MAGKPYPIIHIPPCAEWEAVLDWLYKQAQAGALNLSESNRRDVQTLIYLCPAEQWTSDMQRKWAVIEPMLGE